MTASEPRPPKHELWSAPLPEEPPAELKEALWANLHELERLVVEHEIAEEGDDWNYDEWKEAYDETYARIEALFASLESQLEREQLTAEEALHVISNPTFASSTCTICQSAHAKLRSLSQSEQTISRESSKSGA